MQLRRRWSAIPLVALATFLATLGAPSALAAPVDPAQAAAQAAKDLAAAKGTDAVKIRTDIIANAPTTLLERDTYATNLAKNFKAQNLLTDANPDGQLNAAIVMAQIQTLSSDGYLEEMLASNNAGVRYWGAKGLGDIANKIGAFGGTALKNATNALTAAMAKETSGIIKKEIINTLAKLGVPSAMIDAVNSLATGMQSTFPDAETLTAAAAGVDQLDKMAVTMTPAEKTQAAQAAAWSGSFAIQHERAVPKADLPKNFHAGVARIVDASVTAINKLVGKPVAPSINGDADMTFMLFSGVVGTAGTGPGSLQKELPGVAVPPYIKPPTK